MAGSSPTGLPSDGKGGYLWHDNITFPVYPSLGHSQGSSINITWANSDAKFRYNEQVDATAGVCFGTCLLAFLNIIALTPKSKRGLPLYTFILVALALLITRYLTLMVLYTALEAGSAYYSLIEDFADGETVQSIIGIILIIWLPPAAFLFVVLGFYVQGKCVLVLIAMRHRYLYRFIMSYLSLLSICTVAFRICYAALLTVYQFNLYFNLPNWMNTAALTTYTATIISWSLVFSWQVGLCLISRYKLGGSIDKSEGMAILFMTSVESMLIPMIFTVLQLCNPRWFSRAEYLIMPSVACILPFGSIWAGAANQHATLQRAVQHTPDVGSTVCTNCAELLASRPFMAGHKQCSDETVIAVDNGSSSSSSPHLAHFSIASVSRKGEYKNSPLSTPWSSITHEH